MNDALGLLFGVFGPCVFAVLVASVTIFLVLRRTSRPRLFILWIMGLHTLIVSAVVLFLTIHVLFMAVAPSAAQRDLRFDSILGTCMGLGILLEGILIYLVCCRRSNSRPPSAAPSIFKTLFAVLMGNILSIGGFWIYVRVFDVLSALQSQPTLSD